VAASIVTIKNEALLHMTNHHLTAAGFTVLYCALMGGLILLTIPHVEGMRDKLGLLLLPPCVVIGGSLMIYGMLRADSTLIP
jgi:hypothetical protein